MAAMHAGRYNATRPALDSWVRVAVVWSSTAMQFYVNDVLSHTIKQASWCAGACFAIAVLLLLLLERPSWP